MNFSDDRVQFIFDEMGPTYDNIQDLWYSWLFCRIHFFIVKDVLCQWTNAPRQVLDAGCGTGFQSFLYANAGANVIGIDISPGLIQVAQSKKHNPPTVGSILKPTFRFTETYNAELETLFAKCVGSPEYKAPEFYVQSLLDLKIPDSTIDHVNCCGSVLSFIDDYDTALREISRVLKPGGTFIFEVEAKYNLDLVWTVLDALTGGHLGYETGLKESIAPFTTRCSEYIDVEYPFGEVENPVYMPIKLYTRQGLSRDFARHKLAAQKWRTIHSITNLVPSTVLDSESPSRLIRRIFSALATLEETLPLRLPGCSIVVTGKKLA
ncbi:MAG TPA: class I SAM-dependent methyltransferase [Pyrinomonadaceae bacterium]|nr:class I SAM-dependent methyltransferase [Pyrinomonadaceae bacterium]